MLAVQHLTEDPIEGSLKHLGQGRLLHCLCFKVCRQPVSLTLETENIFAHKVLCTAPPNMFTSPQLMSQQRIQTKEMHLSLNLGLWNSKRCSELETFDEEAVPGKTNILQ